MSNHKFHIKHFDRTNQASINIILGWFKDKLNESMAAWKMTDFGYMLFDETTKQPICSIFAYPIRGSDIVVLGMPIANPNMSTKTRREAFNALLKYVESDAAAMGYKVAMTFATSEGAKTLFGRENYSPFDSDILSFGKKLVERV